MEEEVKKEKERKEWKQDSFQEKILSIKDELNTIKEAISREIWGKISLTRADQNIVKDAIFDLQQKLIDMVLYHQEELEKVNVGKGKRKQEKVGLQDS